MKIQIEMNLDDEIIADRKGEIEEELGLSQNEAFPLAVKAEVKLLLSEGEFEFKIIEGVPGKNES